MCDIFPQGSDLDKCICSIVSPSVGYYSDGYNVYLEGGILFGTIFGGIIFPPFAAVYFPPPIVRIVVFGPVFAQSVFIGPDRRPFFTQEIFYTEAGVRIFNPRAHCPLSNQCIESVIYY